MQFSQLAQNCPLGSFTRPTRSATVGFCAHHEEIAVCVFKGVSAAFAEHKLSHMSHERTRYMTEALGDLGSGLISNNIKKRDLELG